MCHIYVSIGIMGGSELRQTDRQTLRQTDRQTHQYHDSAPSIGMTKALTGHQNAWELVKYAFL